MVTANTGILTSANAGDGTTSTIANRVLVDFKDALQDYRTTSMDVLSMFAENMETDTGGDIDLTIAKPSMSMEEIDEGTTPAYQHTSLRNERINVKEWGLAVAVTRRMIEDSRFNEVELALNEAKRAVERHVTKHAMYALMGVGNATLRTGVSNTTITTGVETAVTSFANNPHGAFYGKTPEDGSRLVEYGDNTAAELGALAWASGSNTGSHYQPSGGSQTAPGQIALSDVTGAIEFMSLKGANPDTILVSPSHYKSLLDLADFTTALTTGTTIGEFGGSDAQHLQSAAQNGVIGNLFGLRVVSNAWVPTDRYGIFDTNIKPMAYVQRRGLTVEEATPGFGIVGSYLSMRYGMKIVRPEAGMIIYD
tara:strand:+ start:733 stop:1830 length:1098 start_codon:yes stop_codon:yes gene_type:complete